MLIEDQRAVIEFLSAPSTHGGATVDRIDTHSASIFLAGRRAWKLKRAVLFDYLDFSTAERRRLMCEAEVRLNRRTAPFIYRGVVAVTREPDGALALGGAGTAVDWVVEMTRFDQRDLCDRRAADGTLDVQTIERVSSAIARFHATAERRDDHGGEDAMAWVVEGNATGFAQFGADFLDPTACERVTSAARHMVQAHGFLLDTRRDTGFVRQCHGDLHLRNIVLINGEPTLFDAVEFNDEIACIDVFYDVAFLLMDLLKRNLPQHANVVFNRYLAESGDFDALPLVPLFLSCRAAIRAKTSATARSLQESDSRRRELEALAREYLAMAERLLHPPSPTLVAIGGLSGSGKSTLALRLAPAVGAAPGAVVLRSDEIRKALCGVPRLVALGPEGYRPEVSARVYRTLADRAARVLAAGHSVIVDAAHAHAAEREAIERVAVDRGVFFIGLWLDAPEAVLIERVSSRRHDPSDADAGVIRMQLGQSPGPITWQRIDAAQSGDEVLRYARMRVPVADSMTRP